MKRFLCSKRVKMSVSQKLKMSTLPPRKISTSSGSSKQHKTPLQILLQMGFSKHRALKALAATGNRSVQLASDWLLTHVNDSYLDVNEPREYIFYASPTGPLLTQLLEFWEKSKSIAGWNGAHNFPPHITLVSFFKAPDETSLQIAKAVKNVVESVGNPPECPLKVEPYLSHNFMGLFVSDEHAEYLKKIAVQYVKQVSSALGVTMDTYEHLDALGTCFPWCTVPQEKPIKWFRTSTPKNGTLYSTRGESLALTFGWRGLLRIVNLKPHVKSLHITLAYHFDMKVYDALKTLVDEMQPFEQAGWEVRLYSRDPRFANHQVYRVTQGYEPKASDELELVLGDYIYIEEEEFNSTSDGWLHGTSWLTGNDKPKHCMIGVSLSPRTAANMTRAIKCLRLLNPSYGGVSGYLPAVYTRRTAESDAWTLHRAMSLNNNKGVDAKSESESNTDGDVPRYPHENATMLGHEKSEETYKHWENYWDSVKLHRVEGIVNFTAGGGMDFKHHASTDNTTETQNKEANKRWVFAMRHGERVDLTYGHWVQHCFDDQDNYVRKDLNLPLALGPRAGGKDAYAKDSPLTRVGRFQAGLVGEALRLAGLSVSHVYTSASLRCVETAHEFVAALQPDPPVKIRVEPGLFEYKYWYSARGMAPFMTNAELHNAGYNVDIHYKPYIDLDIHSQETLEEFYERNEKVVLSVLKDTEAEGGNILFVGHASTLDMTAMALKRLDQPKSEHKPYQVSKHLLRVPYCAFAALRPNPWRLVTPPVPPSINSSSGRFDWRILEEE